MAGGYAYGEYQITTQLLMRHTVDLSMDNHILIFGFWHLMIIGLFIVVGYWLTKPKV